jgi:oligopeptide/dipeptide ABC transporter ATP-binding protein
MSGGQLQRVAIARALALNPALIVCDEPISSLDVSTQAQVINLLRDSQARLGMAYLFIGHNLAVVSHISDRLAIMYRGRIVEIGDSAQVYHHPKHPYTQQLLSAVLSIDPRRKRLRGSSRTGGPAPDIARLAGGCPYVDRCPKAMDVCRAEDPPEVDVGDGTTVRCHLYRPSPAPVA